MNEEILLQVNKPARYIGSEWNIPKKDFKKSKVRFLLSFPDLYEVGMSNLGIKILYGLLNKIPDTSCERVFSCGMDLENILRSRQESLVSLETHSPMSEFDIIGFSLGSELDYTNVLNILDLGNIPLHSASRDNRDPLIIGGGPGVLNPEPMHAFFDLFLIGEAEEAIAEIVAVYREYKERFRKGEITRQDLLFQLTRVEGVYVPSFYETEYSPSGELFEFRPRREGVPLTVKKRFVSDLDSSHFPVDCIIPFIQVIHDRITLEIMRGCPNSCRFCQARSQYFPFRIRKREFLLRLAREAYEKSGYEEISLGGLSVSDYPEVKLLSQELSALFKAEAVSVSLPSLKAKALVGDISSLLANVKKTGLTFAPEAGSKHLREVIGKDFSEEDFFKALEDAFRAGYRHVKLYFMIGLPGEKEEDLDEIINLANSVSQLRKRISCAGAAQVNISVNTLIPKPHTALQWQGMEPPEAIRHKQDYLKAKAGRIKKLKVSFHNIYMSCLEGLLSRGDRRLSEVILLAFKKGARFDAWEANFSFAKWQEAFSECGIDPYAYLKGKRLDERLPWDFLDLGLDKELLKAEFKKVIAI
ncbi:MAG TPA: TIGR03960 family B12-binding radical SAM protein [Candidatus Margulisiibacteriota bacterium]|nr:TIGR03960 family B12-binding radical SAM protein [Candidatus Margulisiibacteriota bacterium]